MAHAQECVLCPRCRRGGLHCWAQWQIRPRRCKRHAASARATPYKCAVLVDRRLSNLLNSTDVSSLQGLSRSMWASASAPTRFLSLFATAAALGLDKRLQFLCVLLVVHCCWCAGLLARLAALGLGFGSHHRRATRAVVSAAHAFGLLDRSEPCCVASATRREHLQA